MASTHQSVKRNSAASSAHDQPGMSTARAPRRGSPAGVREPFVQEIGPDDLFTVDKSFVSEEMITRESDIIYRVGRGEEDLYVFVLVEFQSTPDTTMPVRVLSYVMRLYEQLLVSRRSLPLPAVLPIVLYNGFDPWRVPDRLEAVIEQRIDIDQSAKWAQMVLRPRADIALTERIQSLSEVKPMLAKLAEQLREEGREEGVEQGRAEALREVARRLLKKGLTVDDIAQTTGLSTEELREIERDEPAEG